jgi:hypothetical protein
MTVDAKCELASSAPAVWSLAIHPALKKSGSRCAHSGREFYIGALHSHKALRRREFTTILTARGKVEMNVNAASFARRCVANVRGFPMPGPVAGVQKEPSFARKIEFPSRARKIPARALGKTRPTGSDFAPAQPDWPAQNSQNSRAAPGAESSVRIPHAAANRS